MDYSTNLDYHHSTAGGAFPFNTSMEGDMWSFSAPPADTTAAGTNALIESPPLHATTAAADVHAAPLNLDDDALFIDTAAISAAAPPSLDASSFDPSSLARLTSGPPAHLLANSTSTFNPFAAATFEMEREPEPALPIASPTRGLSNGLTMTYAQRGYTNNTNNGISNGFNSGNLAPLPSAQPLQNQYNSLIDAEDVTGNNQTTHSRKRMRTSTGTGVVAPANLEPPMLYSPQMKGLHLPSLPQQHQQQQQRSNDSPFSHSPHSHTSGIGTDRPTSTLALQARLSELEKDEQKKVKHQLTDRQRRANIKKSMDELKALVPLDTSQKVDQATVVASSVSLIHSMKDEVAQLRAKLQAMELSAEAERAKQERERQLLRSQLAKQQPQQLPLLSNSPFTSLTAALNGAGVSLWRIDLSGKIVEVNLVFELVSGFSAREVCGNSPCGPPLFGSLSVMPEAFLKTFSTVGAVPSIESIRAEVNANANADAAMNASHIRTDGSQPLSPSLPPQLESQQSHSDRSLTGSSSNSMSDASDSQPASNGLSPLSPTHSLTSPHSPQSHSPTGSSGAASTASRVSSPALKGERNSNDNGSGRGNANSSSGGEVGSSPIHAPAAAAPAVPAAANIPTVAPLYANASITQFPVVPQAQLENFFPFKCKTLIHAQIHAGVTQPQPHGTYLVNHLAGLPPHHVLKLLSRHNTMWGEILER